MVDSRQFFMKGQRPARLRRDDVPLLVRGLIAVLRKRAKFGAGQNHGLSCVRIWDGGNCNLVILEEDWKLIFPFIADGTLDPLVNRQTFSVAHLHPNTSFQESVLDQADRPLYDYMVGLLTPLFPLEWPKSSI